MMRTARPTTEAGPPRPGEDKERDATALARVVALKRMPVNDLKAEWKNPVRHRRAEQQSRFP
jgi:hypothetical protein